jgi:site-specific DNA recombinase
MEENRKTRRCAIYTRKSTEEGLDQDFNSLQAQRESAEAYIRSQQLAGWVALAESYDDGGFSGASLERPAMKELLQAIEAGKIDVVVVYKVDRLSRSLLDFARLMSLFDGHGVSFVSVTQEFNTTTSLGRLTLNILLSFAQFEREIISERTRDKLSAARKKGKWIGGIPVLGYDVDPRGGRLVVNEQEAVRVREIFAICERAGTLAAGLREVSARGLQTKQWLSRSGRLHHGKTFTMQGLSALLTNVLYKGCISHKGTIYPGEQEPIVERGLWEKVNRTLALNGSAQEGRKHRRQEALLRGVARCGECGAELKPTFTTRQGRRHMYYVCSKGRKGCRQRPVAAQDLESSLRERLEKVLGPQPSTVGIQQAVERVSYTSQTRMVQVALRDSTRFEYSLAVPNRPGVHGAQAARTGRIPRISKLMALAIKMESLVREGKVSDYTSIAAVGHLSKPRLTQIMNLTNLAPEIQEELLFLPKTMLGADPITERQMRPIVEAVDWSRQRKLFRDAMAKAQAQ